MIKYCVAFLVLWYPVLALIPTIEVFGKFFVNSVTREPFYIRGVDYQPGGEGGVSKDKDPLSDPEVCARDITLFQDLNINTIRIYSVNPNLDHDKCMTLLAKAGIYLVLDVNSPLDGQHLNRYEPWTTYTEEYLDHVFKVVYKFSHYDNTLAFFAGNEIINDKKSAKSSPPFVKQLISDIKTFMEKQCPRNIPVGYSAADDLDYRVSLSKYLECDDSLFPKGSVDFYGVNTYQWCGHQDFYSSGFDKLVDDHMEYSKPVFFSEFGCNKKTPRLFEEIETIYSEDMFTTFSGGLVYEFSQESNNYGLVEINKNTKEVRLLEDYNTLKEQYEKIKTPKTKDVTAVLRSLGNKKAHRKTNKTPFCEDEYKNLDITKEPPYDLAKDLISKLNPKYKKGSYVEVSSIDMINKFKISSSDGSAYHISEKIKDVQDISKKPNSAPDRNKNPKHKGMYLELFFPPSLTISHELFTNKYGLFLLHIFFSKWIKKPAFTSKSSWCTSMLFAASNNAKLNARYLICICKCYVVYKYCLFLVSYFLALVKPIIVKCIVLFVFHFD